MENQANNGNNGIGLLAKAYVRATAKVQNVVKNAANPHFGSNYADLSAVLDIAKPAFAEEGLALLQAPAEIEGDKLTLVGVLLHESGQSVSFRTQLPIGKATPQAAGGAITYARRYQWAAVAGLAQVDDDGNDSSGSKSRGRSAGKEDTSYAAKAEELIARVAATETLADLESLKAEVADLGDQKVADAYLARKKELKGAKK